jgi:hypothetical protein
MTDQRYRIWDGLNGVFWTREIMATDRGQLSGGCYVEDASLAGRFTEEEIGGMRAASLLRSWHEVRAEESAPTTRPLDGASTEARHTCRLLLWMMEEALLPHPAIQSNPDWRGAAQYAVRAFKVLHVAMDPDAE